MNTNNILFWLYIHLTRILGKIIYSMIYRQTKAAKVI